MLISVLSFPEIASIAGDPARRERGGLEALLIPAPWGDISQIADLARLTRSNTADGRPVPSGATPGVEGALVVLEAFFQERAPAAYRMLPAHSPVSCRILATAEEYGLVIDVGETRVLIAALDRAELISVAEDLLGGPDGGRIVTVHAGGANVFSAGFASGEALSLMLAARPGSTVSVSGGE